MERDRVSRKGTIRIKAAEEAGVNAVSRTAAGVEGKEMPMARVLLPPAEKVTVHLVVLVVGDEQEAEGSRRIKGRTGQRDNCIVCCTLRRYRPFLVMNCGAS